MGLEKYFIDYAVVCSVQACYAKLEVESQGWKLIILVSQVEDFCNLNHFNLGLQRKPNENSIAL